MAAKTRKSVVQNIIKNLLEMEIPEIQTASKELADWIKQLEQHSFKLQHYATEIENWASEEEEAETVELTDLIKDLEATLSDMRTAGSIGTSSIQEQTQATAEKLIRGYGRTGKTLKDSKAMPKSELKKQIAEKAEPKQLPQVAKAEEPPVKKETARASQGVTATRDSLKIKPKSEFPIDEEELSIAPPARKALPPADEDDIRGGYMTPEGFLIRKIRQ